jgi:hypothetical protein
MQWRREHDLPGAWMDVPAIEYPTTLERLIAICRDRPPDRRLHAAGSHWALSTAAMSDHTHVETHDPTNAHAGMDRTLHEVIPYCMHPGFLQVMAQQVPPKFEDNSDGDTTSYFVHIETGKRIYQAYAELDEDTEDDPDSLARELSRRHGTEAYFGPWAFRTLGGAGGQTVFGALTTGTHGGDFKQPPVADSVAAMHLVADGGRHFWIEPSPHQVPLTDDGRLKALYGDARYGGPGNFEVIRDDDVFNAVLVSAGRFGVVYSVVLRVVRQYMLHESVKLGVWQDVKDDIANYQSGLYRSPPINRFLQVAVCLTPYGGFLRNQCGVTKRWNVDYDPATGPPNGRDERVGPNMSLAGASRAYAPDPDDRNKGAEASLLERACSSGEFVLALLEEVIEELTKLVEEHKVAAGSSVAAVALIGGAGALAGLLVPLAALLAWLTQKLAQMRAQGGGQRLGQVLDDLRGGLLDDPDPADRAAGVFVWQLIAYLLFREMQKEVEYDAISYAIMDRHDYLDLSCNVNVDSIEVFFSADDPLLIAFVDALIAYETKQELLGRACVGYASLRFTGKTRALIGPARWERTAVVEVAVLKDVKGSQELIDYAVKIARSGTYHAILHWGQRNDCNRAEVEARFGDDLRRWRDALATVTGGRDGFSSAFTRQTGLEP